MYLKKYDESPVRCAKYSPLIAIYIARNNESPNAKSPDAQATRIKRYEE